MTFLQVPFIARALAVLLILAVVAGPVGVLVMLRGLAFSTDTIAHAVFPGVAAGFVLAGEPGVLPGAAVAAVLTAVVFTALSARVRSDTSLAVLLTSMFAFGVILVSRRSSYTADLTAFLFGRVLYTSPAQLAQTAVLVAVVLVVLVLCWRALVLVAFDPVTAAAQGYRTRRLDLLLNVLVALVVVAGARAIGTLLMIALLIVPAAAARLLSHRLRVIVPLACAVAGAASWAGLEISYQASVVYGWRLASGATVVLALIALFLAAQAVHRCPWRGARRRRGAGAAH
ncbi:metal ABC transporter permease [Nonomuraea aridisoli]|uniref:Manganese transporter n=1 Tax=Nonomuraea aridisoli TaxID=2070368 RepID=A0A2W2EXN7_9ACTN|nr:metal ABC transporter permease [Nonomuraea aridisoli]PZG21015.1 manganese transporter [Nonomuraea aridisoli]